MARVKSMFRKAALNSIGDRLFTILGVRSLADARVELDSFKRGK